MKTINVTCKNNQQTKAYPKGITLKEIAEDMQIQLENPILCALVNHRLRDLNYDLYKPKVVEFLDINNAHGRRLYARSTIFLLYRAIKDLYPQAKLRVGHSLPGGWYCELDFLPMELSDDVVVEIHRHMKKIVEADESFRHERLLTADAIELFEADGLMEKVELLKTRNDIYSSVYRLGQVVNYFYGNLLPSSGYITDFDLKKYYSGLLLCTPNNYHDVCEQLPPPQKSKLFKVFREHSEWLEILKVPYVGDLNHAVMNDQAGELIKISEALHEKKIASIADEIVNHPTKVKLVLISGPSSSGKTTFSKRLSVQLQVLGYKPVQISLDDYFVDREYTPRDKHGDYDFEALNAIDVAFFNQQLLQLMNGEEVEIPSFDFIQGKRYFSGKKLRMEDRSILLVEGIHGLNPDLTNMIPDDQKYKIFVSALTHIAIDMQNPIPSTDNRLIRRIVRDNLFRGYDALSTIQRWKSVRKGEEKNIFPYQENANVMFNSALLFELAVLKKHAEPILKEVAEIYPEYTEATRLLKFLSYFKSMDEKEIPPTSILLEFLGGSSFIY